MARGTMGRMERVAAGDRRHTESSSWSSRSRGVHGMGARVRSNGRTNSRAPVRTTLAGGESCRGGSAIVAWRRPTVAELCRADAVVRLHRQSSIGICGHDQRRWASPDVVPRTVARANGTDAGDTRRRERLRVSTSGCTHTSSSRGPSPASSLYPVGANLPLVSRAGGGQRIERYVFVYVDGLGMLSEVVETRESSLAVALKRALASVFPVEVPCQHLLRYSKPLETTNSYLMCLARCSLRVKLSLHGGYPLQKKRWLPFFFLLDRVPSAFTLPSPSESPQSSSPAVSLSESSTSISSESLDFFDTVEFARAWDFVLGVDSSVSMAPSGNGDCGNGFCVAIPAL